MKREIGANADEIVIDERMESATLRAREANVTATHRR